MRAPWWAVPHYIAKQRFFAFFGDSTAAKMAEHLLFCRRAPAFGCLLSKHNILLGAQALYTVYIIYNIPAGKVCQWAICSPTGCKQRMIHCFFVLFHEKATAGKNTLRGYVFFFYNIRGGRYSETIPCIGKAVTGCPCRGFLALRFALGGLCRAAKAARLPVRGIGTYKTR